MKRRFRNAIGVILAISTALSVASCNFIGTESSVQDDKVITEVSPWLQ